MKAKTLEIVITHSWSIAQLSNIKIHVAIILIESFNLAWYGPFRGVYGHFGMVKFLVFGSKPS